MEITLIAVGKLKEPFFREACAVFTHRLSKLCQFHMIEVKDEKTDEKNSDSQNEMIKSQEGKDILKHIPPAAYVIALAIEGKRLDTNGFAQMLRRREAEAARHMVFIIGGSLGLSREVLKRADFLFSFSPMTFPHQLMRILFLEQLTTALTEKKKEK